MAEPDTPPVLLTIDGSIALLSLNRARGGNSLSMDTVKALRGALSDLAQRTTVKVIILSGEGGRIFSAGHDLNEFHGQQEMDFLSADFAGITALMQQIMAQPQIVIAKVQGVATAAGCELVAACDLALAADTARFGVPGVNIGFWCHTPQVPLSRTVGKKAAMMMLSTGQLFPASYALQIGLINAVHPSEGLDKAVEDLAQTIASKSASVLRRGKQSFYAQADLRVAAAYDVARAAALDNIVDPNAREGIAAFIEKRDPRWQD